MMKRYLSVWLPDWPLTRLYRAKRAELDLPFVLVDKTAHGLRLACVNAAARAQGLEAGLRFADAKARLPDLVYTEMDHRADARALEGLASWMIRFAPLVALDGTDGVMLEVTGCAHLYGGEAEMVAHIGELLAGNHICAQLGVASTQGAAWALARHRAGVCLAHGETRTGLASLPVAGLRLSEEVLVLLRRFGLTQIGQLYGIDRKALARRFRSTEAAGAVLLRLDQALGQRADPLDPLTPLPARTARLHCPDPIASTDAVELGLKRLSGMLCDELGKFGQGARGFALHAFRVDGVVSSIATTTAQAIRTPEHIIRLLSEHIGEIDPGFGIDLLLLEAQRAGPVEIGAQALSGDLAASATDTVAVSALVDRIRAKLGDRRVTVPAPMARHIPEHAEARTHFDAEGFGAEATLPPMPVGPRPVRLFDPPERVEVLASVPDGPPVQFVWRRLTRRIVRADGPERIAPEWWLHQPVAPAALPHGAEAKWLSPKLDPRADAALIAKARARLRGPAQPDAADAGEPICALPRARDYYRIEDETGHRYWVFRDGLYDDKRGGVPDWYVQGQFA
jgi:protein ImuB